MSILSLLSILCVREKLEFNNSALNVKSNLFAYSQLTISVWIFDHPWKLQIHFYFFMNSQLNCAHCKGHFTDPAQSTQRSQLIRLILPDSNQNKKTRLAELMVIIMIDKLSFILGSASFFYPGMQNSKHLHFHDHQWEIPALQVLHQSHNPFHLGVSLHSFT